MGRARLHRTRQTGRRVGELGDRVAVIGGGNTAIDARPRETAWRASGDDVLSARRGAHDRLRFRICIRQERRRRVSLQRAPVRIGNGEVTFVRTELRDGKVVPIAGTEFTRSGDAVIRAIGQSRLERTLDAFGVETDDGVVRVDDAMRTKRARRVRGRATACSPRASAMRWSSKPPNTAKPRRAASTRLAREGARRWPICAALSPESRSPNPFWLASAPPTNCGYQVMRAFEAGLGRCGLEDARHADRQRDLALRRTRLQANKMIGMNNIELITDRPLDDNLREIGECKKAFPDRAIVASLMNDLRAAGLARTGQARARSSHRRLRAQLRLPARDVGARHGRGGRPGSGSDRSGDAWVKEVARVPVIVKLTPNITDVRVPARAAAPAAPMRSA